MSIQDFFKGKSIFITGGSGFIGKVLIEKLLRSCEGIEKIYFLIRAKKGISPQERLQIILDCPLFEKLKRTNARALEKLIPMIGDVSQIKLGLSNEDMQTIVEEVDIIYHGAASVRFDDHLKDSILLNVRGTREVVELALRAKKSVTFVHISTAYCNCDRKYIEEKLYPPHADWRNSIKIAEELDQHLLNIFSAKYIHPLPNTYVFAKSLGEHVVHDLCKGKILTAIVRPSVVVPTLADPIPGWIENFNGPLGLLTAGGKGVLRIGYTNGDAAADYIPVDAFVRMTILLTYEKASSGDRNEVSIYNASSYNNLIMTNRYLITMGRSLTWHAPFTRTIWYPSFTWTNNWYIYYIAMVLYLLPALLLDGLKLLLGKNTTFVKLHRKIYVANMAIIYFMQNSFQIVNYKTMSLDRRLDESEKEIFSLTDSKNFHGEETYAYYLNSKIGSEQFLFKEEFNRERGFRNAMILWIIHYSLVIFSYGLLVWYLVAILKITDIFCNIFNNYVTYLNKL